MSSPGIEVKLGAGAFFGASMSDDKKLKIWTHNRGYNPSTSWDFVALNFDCFEDQQANLEAAAEAFADKFYHDYDGWETTWPITFYIGDEDGKLLGKVKVHCDFDPQFSGKVVRDE